MKVLVLCDDKWHPAETVMRGLEPLREIGFHFKFMLAFEDWREDLFSEYAVLLLSKSNTRSRDDQNEWLSPQVEQSLQQYVEQGGGLLIVHSGIVGYKDSEVMLSLTGGFFERHPEQCPVTVRMKSGHPLAVGLTDFMVIDEHYFVRTVHDKENDYIMDTCSSYGSQPGGWTRLRGQGRICVLTPGHNQEVWQQEQMQVLLARAMEWCASTAVKEAQQ